MMHFIGIDSGSTMCKSVLFDGEHIVDVHIMKTGWDPKLSANESLDILIGRNCLERKEVIISATGYGREMIDYADFTFTEITCHAFGGISFSPSVNGIIDIGGQDSKVIQIEHGRVANFLMNDKCAAGTGRFLMMACETLCISIDDIDIFVNPDEFISVNSMCTVFAESEIIGLLAMGKDRSKIMAGVLHSIAHKIYQMTSKFGFTLNDSFLMTGGLSKSKSLMGIISQTIGCDVMTHEYALFAGAVGACICACKKTNVIK